MTLLDAVLAGTHVLPAFGHSVLTKDMLDHFADQLRGAEVPILREHDLDQPMPVTVVSAEVRPTPDGEYELHVVLDGPDDVAEEIVKTRGMSIGFGGYFSDPEEATDANVGLQVDPRAFSDAELAVAIDRLALAGFRPRAGYYYQLADVTLGTVVLDILRDLPAQMGWALLTTGIIEGLKVLVRRGRTARYRFVLHGDDGDVVAEIETSSERAFTDAVKDLRKIDRQNGGMFIRDTRRKEWRRAGGKRPSVARKKAARRRT